MVLALMTACGAAASPDATPAVVGPAFWPHWGDGKAEIDAYHLVTPRYGELRTGTAVLVFVTEDFTEGQRVKSDGGHGDEYPVLKLNDVRHFRTGVYDYEVMTSTFVRIDGQAPLGQPVKVSLSVQEWCGHVYASLHPRDDGQVDYTLHSYFDGEGDRSDRIALPRDGVLADVLPIAVRGIAGDVVPPGGEVELPALPTLLHTRFAHESPARTTVRIRRSAETARVEVPAGAFDVFTVESTVSGATTAWKVEAAWPHRIVAWDRSDGERAELVGSDRLPYWTMNAEGAEEALRALGIFGRDGADQPGTSR